jgi:hypothetical protein
VKPQSQSQYGEDATIQINDDNKEATFRSPIAKQAQKLQIHLSPQSEPSTPELSPSALNTTILRTFRKQHDDSVDTTVADINADSNGHRALSRPVCPEEGGLGDDVLATIDSFSPPKTSKMLQPRRTAAGESTGEGANKGGWIPEISITEWDSAPSFLKIQVMIS